MTATDKVVSVSTVITITSDNIVNKSVRSTTLELTRDGATATPLNDVATWLRTDSTGSSLAAGYTTLSQLIDDPNTLRALMADESAMQYLTRSTGFADEGCANETFMTLLGQSKHVDSTVLNSDIWSSAICDSSYFELVLKDKVPTMTSNTIPSGKVTASVEPYEGIYYPFHAFDGDNTTKWVADTTEISDNTAWIQYEFTNQICVKKFRIVSSPDKYLMEKLILQASNDGIVFNKLFEKTFGNISNSEEFIFNINNKNFYKVYRIVGTGMYTSIALQPYVQIAELQLYGRSQ